MSFDASFRNLQRTQLDGNSWVDHAPGWVQGADELFTQLAEQIPWRQRTGIPMYDQLVTEPRLTWWPTDTDDSTDTVDLPAVIDDLGAALSGHYDEPLGSIACNLYRDGADSVAWHRDRNRFHHPNPLVAIVSLGARRSFRMRPFDRPSRSERYASVEFRVGEGDLLVMGGACQHEWEHAVPKVAHAPGPRISVMFRGFPIDGEP